MSSNHVSLYSSQSIKGSVCWFRPFSLCFRQKITLLGTPWVPKRSQSVPIWLIIIYYTHHCHLDPFRASLCPYVNFGQLTSVLGPKWPFWPKMAFLGPLWIPKRPQGVSIWLIIMYFTCEKCFRAIWTLPEHHRVRMLISASLPLF